MERAEGKRSTSPRTRLFTWSPDRTRPCGDELIRSVGSGSILSDADARSLWAWIRFSLCQHRQWFPGMWAQLLRLKIKKIMRFGSFGLYRYRFQIDIWILWSREKCIDEFGREKCYYESFFFLIMLLWVLCWYSYFISLWFVLMVRKRVGRGLIQLAWLSYSLIMLLN